MPKDTSSTAKCPRSGSYVKKPRTPKVQAVRTATATSFYVTPGQFSFIRHQKPEYSQHRRNPEARQEFLNALWLTFLETYPEHNIPPFPEDADMVKRFHQTRAYSLGKKLDNMIDFASGTRRRLNKPE